MDESQGSPRPKEDSETDASDSNAVVSPSATKPGEIIETPATNRATDRDDGSDSEVLALTPKARVKYGKAASRRRLNAISSDAAGPTSSAVATEAAARSVTASVIEEEDGDVDENRGYVSPIFPRCLYSCHCDREHSHF